MDVNARYGLRKGKGKRQTGDSSARTTIRRDALEGMLAHARREFPLECCGFLTAGEQGFDRIFPVANEERSPTGFQVPAREILDFFRNLRARGTRAYGIYHSHPGSPPVPSERDRREFHYPEAFYWIVSLDAEHIEVRCYLWGDDDFQEVPFRVE